MVIEGRNINLRTVVVSDAPFILQLRMDNRKNRFLSRVENDLQKQISWIQDYLLREKNGQEYYFVIEDKQCRLLGVVRVYDFRENSFCWGSWIIKDGSPASTSIESALMVYEFAFFQLGFGKSHFDVRKENLKVISFHKRFGARIVGQDDLNFYFIFDKDSYLVTRKRYAKYLR